MRVARTQAFFGFWTHPRNESAGFVACIARGGSFFRFWTHPCNASGADSLLALHAECHFREFGNRHATNRATAHPPCPARPLADVAVERVSDHGETCRPECHRPGSRSPPHGLRCACAFHTRMGRLRRTFPTVVGCSNTLTTARPEVGSRVGSTGAPQVRCLPPHEHVTPGARANDAGAWGERKVT